MNQILIEKLTVSETANLYAGEDKKKTGGNSGVSTDACSCCCPKTDPVPM